MGELSDVNGYYDLIYNTSGDNYKTIKSFRSFNKAKKFAEDIIRKEKKEYSESAYHSRMKSKINEKLLKEGPGAGYTIKTEGLSDIVIDYAPSSP